MKFELPTGKLPVSRGSTTSERSFADAFEIHSRVNSEKLQNDLVRVFLNCRFMMRDSSKIFSSTKKFKNLEINLVLFFTQ